MSRLNHSIQPDLCRRRLLHSTPFLLAALLSGRAFPGFAQDFDIEIPGEPPYAPPVSGRATIFTDVRIFDGTSPALSAPSAVLVRDGRIERIATEPISDAREAWVIAGGGRVLMPGLIDAHWHAFIAATPQPVLMTGDASYLALLAAQEATATLMRGFTTIRDLGGPVFGLKRAIDEGVIAGPRIYPSGAMISQTSGMAISASPSRCRASRAARSAIPSSWASPPSPTARTRSGCGAREQLGWAPARSS